MFKNYLNFASK